MVGRRRPRAIVGAQAGRRATGRAAGRVLTVHALLLGLTLLLRSAHPLTISTWNLLAPCHKNAPCPLDVDAALYGTQDGTSLPSPRESEDESLWRPRTDALVGIVRSQLLTSDIIW